jgi:alpha-beta hydrolase superfamily lysophospholipase
MWSLSDSHCRGELHLPRISVPSFVIQSDADTGVFPSDAEAIFNGLGARDKLLEMIPGDHYLQEPTDARDGVADRIAGWLSAKI